MNYDPRKAIRQAMMIARREVTAPNKASIKGQRHILAYITPYEAELLMRRGGSGRLTEYGVPAFDDGDGAGNGGGDGSNDADGMGGGDAPGGPSGTDAPDAPDAPDQEEEQQQTAPPSLGPPGNLSALSTPDPGPPSGPHSGFGSAMSQDPEGTPAAANMNTAVSAQQQGYGVGIADTGGVAPTGFGAAPGIAEAFDAYDKGIIGLNQALGYAALSAFSPPGLEFGTVTDEVGNQAVGGRGNIGGAIGGIAGMASGVPGAGTVGGMIGSQVADALGVPSHTFSFADGGAARAIGGGTFSGQKYPDVNRLAKASDKFIYHSGVIDDYDHMKDYLEPQHGPWIQELANHAGDIEPNELLERATPLVWFSDSPTWVGMKVARKLQKPVSDITEEDIRQHGHLALIPRKGDHADHIYHIGEDGLNNGQYSQIKTLSGKTKKAYETDLYDDGKEPFGVERNEYVSARDVEPLLHLTGDHLVNFLRAVKDPTTLDATKMADGGEITPPRDLGADPTVQQALNVTREYQDPPTKHIDDWAWKSLSDVQNRLGNFREIPSHVQAFGSYMDEIAKRAANEGLSARDLIKAYTITRASIQRRAAKVDRVRAAGLDLPQSFTGKIRPEGAFGEWLHTRAGQDYLNSAERGEVNEDAIAHAVKIMTPFGKHEKDIPDALRWAASNLPGKEQTISSLVANAMRGASEPAEWRAMAKDVRGIGPSKAGFLASLMGRGDQPTLDARQIIEHTGRPTSEAQKYLRRKKGQGATEAVERLSARQQAMDLQLPEELKPYYQHLTHHAVWDKAANEVTTHEDVMNAMRGAADGGAIDEASILSHPVVHALRLAGLPKLGDPPREGLRGGGSPDDDVVRQALQRVATPFSEDPEVVQQALRIASSLKVPQGAEFGTGSFYSVKQPMAVSDVSTAMQSIPGVDLAPKKELTWEDFYKQGKGGTILNVGGDRSNLGRLTHINNKELAWPVDLHAGPKYMMEPNPGAVWANNPSHATALRKKILEAAEKGPVYGVYAPMGAQAVDSSHNMFDAVMAQVPNASISKKDAKEFDDAIMNGLHVKGNDPKNVALRENAKKELEGWPGILNAKEASEYARNMPGGHRSAIVKFMDSKKWRDMNFPAIGITRVAITDPELKAAAGNMLGHRIVEFDPEKIAEETKFQHSTYTSPTSGRYVGDVPLVQRHYAMPDVVERLLQKPTVSGQVVHPYSMDPLGRSTARKLFEEQKQLQPVNERMINTIGEGLERQKDYGLKKGGSVVDQALRMTDPNRPMVALADLFQRQLRGRPPS